MELDFDLGTDEVNTYFIASTRVHQMGGARTSICYGARNNTMDACSFLELTLQFESPEVQSWYKVVIHWRFSRQGRAGEWLRSHSLRHLPTTHDVDHYWASEI